MRDLLKALAAAALVPLLVAAASPPPLRPWTRGATPELALADQHGKTVDLAAFRGRVVLVNFWATWCEPCREELPSIARLRGKLRGKPFEVLTVNFGEDDEKVDDFVRRRNLSLPVLLDPDKRAATAWKVGGLPMTFLVDAEGRVRYWTFGERDWSEGEPLRVLSTLVAEASGAR